MSQVEVEKYLQDKKVYELFQDLLKDLIVNEPADPIEYLASKLEKDESKLVFILGPPGSQVREHSLQLSDYFNYTSISVGDLLQKETSKKSDLGQEIEQSIKSLQYVRDEIVINIVQNHLEELKKENQNIILEGFPRTRVQGLALQKAGIIPSSFIIMNCPRDTIIEGCLQKIKLQDSQQDDSKMNLMAESMALEYEININQIKEIFSGYYYNVDSQQPKDDILEDMAMLIKYKINNKSPKRAQKIIVMETPGYQKSQLSRNLCQKCGFVYISAQELLSNQVSSNGQHGRVIKESLKSGIPVSDDIIIQLVKERVQKIDARMQGFVLDGFPSTLAQLKKLDDLGISPSALFVLDLEDDEKSLDNTRDTEQSKIKHWKEYLKHVQQIYSHLIFKVNASLPIGNILEKITFHLSNC